MPQRPGTPRLLRQINDRAALELLISRGPLTRAELGELTGLSKVTSGQLLARLETRGLVTAAGERPGGRGPNAALYGVNPSSAYVAGLEVLPDSVTAAVADITGTVVAQVTVDPSEARDPVGIVHEAVQRACGTAGIELTRLRCFVIGTRGVVDPLTGDVRYSVDLPTWHVGILAGLRTLLGECVIIENDVNLAALAEQTYGAARGADDFVILWTGIGQGLGVMLGGRLHRGITGGAGEIGWLPVPGEPLPSAVTAPQTGSFQRLVGGEALWNLARAHGLAAPDVRDAGVADLVRTAIDAGNEDFVEDLAGRLAVGVAAVSVVLDPGLVVLGGDVGRAGGVHLAERVEEAVARACPSRPTVVATGVEGNPVLMGAIVAALDRAREEVFSDTV
ncbi:ROK family transcriptional regulator [Microbispora catharanthi]|uniref:ROK family protein n=1 Tax=Microbispora catharanthi TaxID=1712871 RepID=A0A5N6BST4_9ACTN|nr:ROK family protein [Microbispora catharanthi]KAB8183481.1 ROK family protein [Microbispora catharanthi]